MTYCICTNRANHEDVSIGIGIHADPRLYLYLFIIFTSTRLLAALPVCATGPDRRLRRQIYMCTFIGRVHQFLHTKCKIASLPKKLRLLSSMSGDTSQDSGSTASYVVRRGTTGSTITYRRFDNASHGLDPEFRLLNLAEMKG